MSHHLAIALQLARCSSVQGRFIHDWSLYAPYNATKASLKKELYVCMYML